MKRNSWVVVANKEKAKIYKIKKVGEFEEVASFVHPDIGKKGIDYQEDRLGRSFDRMGTGRHAMEPETTLDDKRCLVFSNILYDFLKGALDHGDYEHLYLVAEPRFLGFIRKGWKPEVLDTVEETLNKDLVGIRSHDLWEHLPITV